AEAVAGRRWSRVEPSLSVLRDSVRLLLPGTPVSIGTGVASGMHDKLKLELDFIDFHVYTRAGEAMVCPEGASTLGEIGCIVDEPDRASEEVWRRSQECLAQSLDRVAGAGYEAVFLWYLNDPEAGDATSLVFRNEIGAALCRVVNGTLPG